MTAYAVFATIFSHIPTAYQLLMAICLQFLKAQIHDSGGDLAAIHVATNCSFFHSIFTATCMQTSKSVYTLVFLIMWGVVKDILAFQAIRHRMNEVDRLQCTVSRLSRGSLDTRKARTQLLQRIVPSVLPPRTKSAGALTSLAVESAYIPLRVMAARLRASSSDLNPIKELTPVEIEYLDRLTQLYHCREVLLWRMFTSLFVPCFYFITALAIHQLPSAPYVGFIGMANIHVLSQRIGSQLAVRAVIGLIYGRILRRSGHLRAMDQCLFILEHQFVPLQTGCIIIALGVFAFSVTHYGNDTTFQFEWLKHHAVNTTTSLPATVDQTSCSVSLPVKPGDALLISDRASTTSRVFDSSRLVQRRTALCAVVALQSGHYSIDKLLCLNAYSSPSTLRKLTILSSAVLPTLACTLLVEGIPLRDGRLGWRRTYFFFLRTLLRWWIVSICSDFQAQVHLPQFYYPPGKAVLLNLVHSAFQIVLLIATAEIIDVFPVPFSTTLIMPVYAAFSWITRLYVAWKELWDPHDPAKAVQYRAKLFKDFQMITSVIHSMNAYAVFAAIFSRIPAAYQFLMAICLQFLPQGLDPQQALGQGTNPRRMWQPRCHPRRDSVANEIAATRAIQLLMSEVDRLQRAASKERNEALEMPEIRSQFLVQVSPTVLPSLTKSINGLNPLAVESSYPPLRDLAKQIRASSPGEPLKALTPVEAEYLYHLSQLYHCRETLIWSTFTSLFVPFFYWIVAIAISQLPGAPYVVFIGQADIRLLSRSWSCVSLWQESTVGSCIALVIYVHWINVSSRSSTSLWLCRQRALASRLVSSASPSRTMTMTQRSALNGSNTTPTTVFQRRNKLRHKWSRTDSHLRSL